MGRIEVPRQERPLESVSIEIGFLVKGIPFSNPLGDSAMSKQAPFRLLFLASAGSMLCAVALAQDAPTKPKSLANDYIAGSWTMEGTADGKALKGSMRVRPGAGGTCLIYEWSFGESQDNMVRGMAVGGLDPEKNQYVEYMFEEDGSHLVNRFPPPENKNTGVIYGEQTATVNGKTSTGKITVDRKGRGQFIYSVESEQGDVKFTFRRAGQPVSPTYEHLKALEDYIGDWVGEETLVEDMPGVAAKGEKVSYRASFRWLFNKSLCQMDFTVTAPGNKTAEGRYLFAWDALKQEISCSGADSSGGRDWGTIKKVGSDKWVWANNWILTDGKQGSCKDETTILDNNNTHVHEYTNNVVDGEPHPDRKVVYKRVK
jgi:hypothetical protein